MTTIFGLSPRVIQFNVICFAVCLVILAPWWVPRLYTLDATSGRQPAAGLVQQQDRKPIVGLPLPSTRSVLVTGGGGYIGSHAVLRLLVEDNHHQHHTPSPP